MRKNWLYGFLALGLVMAACSWPTGPALTPTPPPTATPTALPTTATSTAPAVPTDTPIPVPPVIGPESAASLVSTVIDLSAGWQGDEPARRLAWPAPGEIDVIGPGGLLAVRIDEQTYDAPLPLNLDGIFYDAAPDGASLAAGSPGGPVTLYDLGGGPISVLDEPSAYGAAYSEDGGWLAVTSANEWAVTIYNARTGERITRLTGFETAAPVYGAMVAPGGKTVAWISRATLQFQDAVTGEMGARLGFEDFIGAAAFSLDGRTMAVYAASGLYLYNTDGEELARLEVSEPVRALAFSPDGKMLAAIYGGAVQLWDGRTLTPIAVLADPPGPFTLLSFSPDGRTLAALKEDKQLVLWKAAVE